MTSSTSNAFQTQSLPNMLNTAYFHMDKTKPQSSLVYAESILLSYEIPWLFSNKVGFLKLSDNFHGD